MAFFASHTLCLCAPRFRTILPTALPTSQKLIWGRGLCSPSVSILYHTLWGLSRGFQKFFLRNFWTLLAQPYPTFNAHLLLARGGAITYPPLMPPSLLTLILYHKAITKSIVKLHKHSQNSRPSFVQFARRPGTGPPTEERGQSSNP